MSWLTALGIALLEKIVVPIVEKVIAKLLLDIRIKKLEEDNEKMRDGFRTLAAAQTDEDYDKALSDIAGSWNK